MESERPLPRATVVSVSCDCRNQPQSFLSECNDASIEAIYLVTVEIGHDSCFS